MEKLRCPIFDVYLSNPLSLFSVTANTLSSGLGLLTGLIVMIVLGQRYILALQPALDALTPGLAFFMISLGVSHILSGDAYGAPTRLPWSVFLWADYRHPSQVYETLAAIGIFLVVMRRPFEGAGAGLNFLLLVAALSAARISLETFRGDSLVLPGGFCMAQVAGLVVLAVSTFLMRKWEEMNLSINDEGILEA